MSLSGVSGTPRKFDHTADFRYGRQGYAFVPDSPPWQVISPLSDHDSVQKDLSRKRSKKTKKHRSKSHRDSHKQQLGSYILQLIGFICLVLAAIKSFEPLTGVGFALVVIGYKGGLDKVALAGLFKEGERADSHKRSRRKEKKHKDVDRKRKHGDSEELIAIRSERLLIRD